MELIIYFAVIVLIFGTFKAIAFNRDKKVSELRSRIRECAISDVDWIALMHISSHPKLSYNHMMNHFWVPVSHYEKKFNEMKRMVDTLK